MIQCKQQVAILLATYNGEKYLREQIDSILNQSFTDWHLYIHDDGSDDGTETVITSYSKMMADKITVLDYPQQGGARNNFFSLLETVEAPYYMFSDQDDVWHRDKVEVSYHRIKQCEKENVGKPIIVHSDLRIVDADMNETAPSFIIDQHIHLERIKCFEDYSNTNTAVGCTMLFNSETKRCVRHPYIKARMHDSWIALSVIASGGIVDYIDKPLIDYRQHEKNCLGAKDISSINISYRIFHAVDMLKENISHYREMNAIKNISIIDFVNAKIRYKKG